MSILKLKAMKNQTEYKPDFDASALIKEVFGQDFYDLTTKKEQDQSINERNARLMIIDSINKCRKLLGENPCVDKTFYKFLDMDFEDLQHLQILYEDATLSHARKEKMLKLLNAQQR